MASNQAQPSKMQAIRRLCAEQSQQTDSHVIQVFVAPSGVPGQYDVALSVERLGIPLEQLEAAILALGGSAHFIDQTPLQ